MTHRGGALAELLAAAGLGFAAAAAAMLVLGTAALRPRLGREGAASDPPDDEARRLLLLRRLKAERPDRFAQIAGRVYRPGGLPSAEALERELARR